MQERTGVKIGEAFMVRTHPQWLRARELVASGRIGALRSIQGFFSYFNTDPKNIRNIAECGGGGLMDIGCYPINTSRFLFGEEPLRVSALLEKDPHVPDRPADLSHPRVPVRPRDVYLQHAAGPVPTDAILGDQRPHRN